MRSNRRRHSRFGTVNRRLVFFVTLNLGILAAGGFAHLVASGSVASIHKEIKSLERANAAISSDIQLEQGHWADLTTPDLVEDALRHHGLHMENPRGERIVALGGAKAPAPGTQSVTEYAVNR